MTKGGEESLMNGFFPDLHRGQNDRGNEPKGPQGVKSSV
jgi:hypothetical protein